MAKKNIKVGSIVFQSGTRANTFKMPVADPVTEIRLAVTGNLDVTVAATLRQLGDLNIFKKITVSRGGRQIKVIGLNGQVASAGKFIYLTAQVAQGFLPDRTAPAVGVAVNPFSYTLPIFFEVPRTFLRNAGARAGALTAIQPSEKSLDIDIDFGTVADVISAGTATLTGINIDVIAVVDTALHGIRNGKTPLMIFAEHSKQLAIASGAGANTHFQDDIDAIGGLMQAALIGFDNSVLTDTAYNSLIMRVNGTDERISGTWLALKAATKGMAGLQGTILPEGLAWLQVDDGLDGTGIIDMSDTKLTKSVKVEVDHDALTATNILALHAYNLIPQD